MKKDKKNYKKNFKKTTKKVLKKSKKIVKKVTKLNSKKIVKKNKNKILKEPELIGEVTHFYNNISVAVIKFKKDISKGVKIAFKGTTTNFEQILDSIQINHQFVEKVKKNQVAGVKVIKKVREGDKVYLLI
ncbi:MAG: hypothetical protein QXO12_02465 [Candidatus Pacearchaeota archaeon]